VAGGADLGRQALRCRNDWRAYRADHQAGAPDRERSSILGLACQAFCSFRQRDARAAKILSVVRETEA
jgi:hypothetical protein